MATLAAIVALVVGALALFTFNVDDSSLNACVNSDTGQLRVLKADAGCTKAEEPITYHP